MIIFRWCLRTKLFQYWNVLNLRRNSHLCGFEMFCWEGILWRSLPAFHVFNLISEFQVLPDWNSQEELGLEGMAAPLTNSPSNQLHFVTDATYPLILLHHQQQFYFQKVAGKKNHQSWRWGPVCGSQCLTRKWNLGKFVISYDSFWLWKCSILYFFSWILTDRHNWTTFEQH